VEYVLVRWLALSHSYDALGIKELKQDGWIMYFCQLQF